MVSILEIYSSLRAVQVPGPVLGETRQIYRGVRTNQILTLNDEGVAYLVWKGHKFLTPGDQVQRTENMSAHDAPDLKVLALTIITNLTLPVEADLQRHLKYIEQFPISKNLFQ